MPRTKKDQLQDFGYSWNTMLKHLVQKDLITDNERDMFLDYFFFYSSDKEIKFISEKYKISKADLQKRMEEISALVQQTFRDLYIDAMKFNAFRDKLETLKFQQMHKMIFVDAFFTKMSDVNFLYKIGIKTLIDLLTKELNPKKTKSAQKENERLLRITQEIIDKIGL